MYKSNAWLNDLILKVCQSVAGYFVARGYEIVFMVFIYPIPLPRPGGQFLSGV